MNYQLKVDSMDLILIQIDSLRKAATFYSTRWKERRRIMRLTEYQKSVIKYYETWGYIPNSTDRKWYQTYIGSMNSYRQEGNRSDDREFDSEGSMTYEDKYGSDSGLPPEYPFQDFNYGP